MTNKMYGAKIANPYAEAFFQFGLSLYIKDDDPHVFYELIFDIQDVLKLLSELPELESFLQNPLYSIESKKTIILATCSNNGISSNTISFLNLLVDKKRIGFIQEIGKRFLDRAYEYVCIKFVEVWSTVKLSSPQQKALTNKINTMVGPVFTEPYVQSANIHLILRIDENILGGLIIKLGSKVIDLSVRGELQRFGKDLNIVL